VKPAVVIALDGCFGGGWLGNVGSGVGTSKWDDSIMTIKRTLRCYVLKREIAVGVVIHFFLFDIKLLLKFKDNCKGKNSLFLHRLGQTWYLQSFFSRSICQTSKIFHVRNSHMASFYHIPSCFTAWNSQLKNRLTYLT
jgi:hypothetical protein